MNAKKNMTFRIWKIDFAKVNIKCNGSQNEGEHPINEIYWLRDAGFTKNGKLRLIDNYNKTWYVDKSFWDSEDAPVWKFTRNKDYGFVIRQSSKVHNMAPILALAHWVNPALN